jgi:hypothetical protein
MFSGIVLILAGIMRVFDAIWAFRYNGPVVNNLHDALFGHNLTTYGWIWLIVGVILIAAGVLVMGGTSVAGEVGRWIGIVAAAIGALTAVSWLPFYPGWSILYIAIAVLVIYGLAAHYDEGAPAH